jgi:hypothetical protein
MQTRQLSHQRGLLGAHRHEVGHADGACRMAELGLQDQRVILVSASSVCLAAGCDTPIAILLGS